MKAPLRRVWLVALCGLVAAVGAGAAGAEDDVWVPLDRANALALERRVRAHVHDTPCGTAQGGYGFARVELVNPDETPHHVALHFRGSTGWQMGGASFRRSLSLAAGERAVLHVPVPGSRDGGTLVFELDGRSAPDSVHLAGGAVAWNTHAPGFLLVAHAAHVEPWRALLAGYYPKVSRRQGYRLMRREAQELPEDWRLVSGMGIVFVHLDEQAPSCQPMLQRYLAAGGVLVLVGSESSSPGPLTDLIAAQPTSEEGTREGTHGMGRWIAVPDAGKASLEAVDSWLTTSGGGRVPTDLQRDDAGVVAPQFWRALEIPGLGEVPVGLFFVLILLFAIGAGPVAYLYLRRRRRLPWLLVAVPAAGFLCTAAILGYGLLSEGLGTTGALRSVTVLDQGGHWAASHAGRTLYAGLQPAALVPAPETFLHCTHLDEEGWTPAPQRMHMDLDLGIRLDGTILPSRTATGFVSASVGRARERLRFRRRAEGGHDVLAAPEFAPLPEAGSVVLHGRDGRWHASTAEGHLVPVTDSARAVARCWAWVSHVDPRAWTSAGDFQRLARMHGERWPDVPPGAYLACVRRPPLHDDLGLDVVYRSERHVVLGLLGAEDVLDE